MRAMFAKGVGSAAIAVMFIAAFASATFAQQGAVTGTVVNGQSLEPINAAQVFIPGTDLGTLTDRDGRYRIDGVTAGQVQVQVRVIGFRDVTESVTIQAGQVATLDFRLSISAVQLEDVSVNIVTGLERRRRQVGTNVGEIKVDEINKAPITDFADLLAGRSEGVILNDVSGTTGTSQRIRIRGSSSLSLSNEPLVVVDGIYFTDNNDLRAGFTGGQEPSRLNDLNPEEIESIEIVKGPAAAALYGTIGANGVILITTKRGTPGGTDWHVYAEGGALNDETDYPLNFEAVQSIGDPNAAFFDEGGLDTDNWQPCASFQAAAGDCQQDQFLTFNTLRDPRTTPFQTGDRQTYGINVSGGNASTTYFISGEYEKEDGVVRHNFNGEEKISARTNLDAALLDNVNVGLSVGFVSRDVDFLNNDNSIFSPILNGIGGTAGFVPGTADNGGPNPNNFLFFRNLEDLGEASLSNQETDRFTGSINGSWQPREWLSAQGTFGLDLVSAFDFVTIQPGLDNLASDWIDGFRNAARNQRQNWTANASLSADFQLTDAIQSTTTAGGSYQEELLNGTECRGAGLIAGTDSCASTSLRFSVDEDFLNVVTIGAFFQQEFSFADKLFVTGSLRLDDNSNFGGNSPLQAYPSANVSYLLSDEDFFPSDGLISELRLRAAFGVAGLRPGFRQAITLFAPITATGDGGQNLPGVTLTSTGNDLLDPERATEWEGGFDMGLLDDRLGLEVTYFRKSSKDALISRPLAPSFGLTTTVFQNLGEIRNQGFEASLRALAIDQRDVRANLTLQLTTLDNEIVDLGEGIEPITVTGSQRHEEGFAAGSFFQNEVQFNDANGDGLIGEDEVTEIVNADGSQNFVDEAIPTWTASASADLELFRVLRFSTLFDARGGYSQENSTEDFRCRQFFQAGRGCEATGAGPNGSLFKQAAFVGDRFTGSDILYIEDAKFLKWREVSVTLSAPASLAQQFDLLRRTTLTFSGRNLATWTGYSGLDPEVNFAGASSNFGQAEFNTQPPVRIFTLRLDVRF